MPRVYPPRRDLIAVRVGPAGLAKLDAKAQQQGVTRSEMIRRVFAWGDATMPDGWKPGDPTPKPRRGGR